MSRFYFIGLIFLFLLVGCTNQEPAVSDSSAYALENIYFYLQAIDDLEAREVLSATAAESQRDFYLAEAQVITGESLDVAEIADTLYSGEGQSWLRWLTFINLIWAFASLMIVLSSAWIFAKYILPLLKRVPVIVYEILLYALCAGFIFGGLYVELGIRQFVALPGVLGLFFLLPFSYERHFAKSIKRAITNLEMQAVDGVTTEAQREAIKQKNIKTMRRDFMIENLVLILIWGAVAIAYQSVMIGFLTVLAMMGALALSPFLPQIINRMGFKKYDPGATVLVVSFALVMIFLISEIFDIQGVYANVFKPGVFWIGTEAYFIALGIVSLRWYHRQNQWRFGMWQIISILSGVGAIFIGVWWNIPVIQEIGGTYLLVYIIEKYVELFDWRKSWAWAGLGLGIILYVVALIMNTYPEFFLLM